ncbi:prealbumin-like fold domain-containing protein [Kitasatospora griseola]|uniref:prealbumin-like fold domain-containing protein n=1 Tax=Kitasatospora griseola TaxID=2064 RepID=UPI003421AA20
MRTLRFLLIAAVLAALPGAAAAAPEASDTLLVTYVARVCDNYDDVMANRARNNLQESLRDLGPDSNYAPGVAVNPTNEAEGTPVPPCRPLPGWSFSTGTGFTAKSPATLQLTTVTKQLRTGITTQDSTPELDAQGNPTGRTLEGAVTVQLDANELAAARKAALVAQGGTKSAPLNGMQDTYGFAALRCSQDNQNGDNAEYLDFPSGTTHVFCYYYAITPPPGAGTITVTKRIVDGSNGVGSFRYDGNLSYADTNNDGVNDFVLTASSTKSASMSFVRGETREGDEPWHITEFVDPDTGWVLVGRPVCTAVNASGGPGTSTSVTDHSGLASVTLAAGDHVTCVYNNERAAGAALLEKESLGGTGTFDLTVTGPPEAEITAENVVTTTDPGVPVTVASAAHPVPGHYELSEVIPAPGPTGHWATPTAFCNGTELPITVGTPTPAAPNGTWQAGYDLVADVEAKCLITNRFVPGGRIDIEKVTEGGTGTFRYTISTGPEPRVETTSAPTPKSAVVTTTAEGTPTTAHPADGSSGPAADVLPVGTGQPYVIQELLPAPPEDGWWELEAADCGPGQGRTDLEQAVVEVNLTADHPTPTCRFTNRLHHFTGLDVVKVTSDDTGLRPGTAHLDLRCPATAEPLGLDVPPGTDRGEIEVRTSIPPATCVLTEPATGAADGVTVVTSAVLTGDDGSSTPITLGEEFTVPAEHTSTVTVTNRMTRRAPSQSPSPSPSPTSTPTPPPSAGAPGGPQPSAPEGPGSEEEAGTHGHHALPSTGSSPLPLLVAVSATVLLLAGGTLFAAARRRRH